MGLEHALFIIVTIALIVLVIAGIVAAGLLIALVVTLKRLAKKAEQATDSLGGLAKLWGKRMAPAAVSGLVATAVKQWRKSKRRGVEDE